MNYSRFYCLIVRKFALFCLFAFTVSTASGQRFTPDEVCALPTFLAGKGVPLGNSASAITSADFNNDGNRDIAYSILNSNFTWNVEIKLGDANSNFTTAGSVSPFVLITSL